MKLRLDPGTRVLGRVLIGGAPLRVLRLSESGARLLGTWREGVEVGESPNQQRLAEKLVAAGMAHPEYPQARLRPRDVTVVVPVRDDAARLAELLPSLSGTHETLVIDDGSVVPV